MAQYERNHERNSDTAGFADMANPMAGFALMQGIANSIVRGNMEFMGLASCRTRAQMELPKHAMTCRSPADAGQLGAQFLRDAVQDYTQFNRRLLGLWVETMSTAGQGDVARQAAELANEVSRPMATAAQTAAERMAEDPAEPWAWWRTDMKGIKPQGNGHHAPEDGRGARLGY